MKFKMLVKTILLGMSHPARGGWIEMEELHKLGLDDLSHPARGGWIEIF